MFRCGNDIVQIDRIRKILEGEHSQAFFRRVFAPDERVQFDALKESIMNSTCAHQPERRLAEWIAGRYAAKEAFAKALGTGVANGVKLNEISIKTISEGSCKGKPYVSLVGTTLEQFRILTGTDMDVDTGAGIDISISHDGDYVFAVCILEDNKRCKDIL